MKTFSVKNWNEFQHYKDRNPPWIKLHNHLLDDYEFEMLSDAAKGHLLCIWMLASRTKNKMPLDDRWITKKIGASSKVSLQALINSGFLVAEQDASNMLHDTKQDATVSVPSEEERRGETEESRVENNSKKIVTNTSAKANLAFDIFKYWCDVMGKSISTSKLTSKREKAIKARLKEGYTVKQIKNAIDGCRKDPFSMGQNDRQKPFNDIELICRNGEKLESFLEVHVDKQGDINSIGTDFSAPEDWYNGE